MLRGSLLIGGFALVTRVSREMEVSDVRRLVRAEEKPRVGRSASEGALPPHYDWLSSQFVIVHLLSSIYIAGHHITTHESDPIEALTRSTSMAGTSTQWLYLGAGMGGGTLVGMLRIKDIAVFFTDCVSR